MNFAGKAVVITGGAGLIGSFLTEKLVAAGARVAVADDFSKGRREFLVSVAEKIDFRIGNLEELPVMRAALAGADVVFHLASRAYGIGYSAGNHMAVLAHNERITNNLLHVLGERRIEYMLIASSSCVYPDDAPTPLAELPVFTGEPEEANRGYGWAKRFLEQKALMLRRETGLPLGIVRPFNIYGERYNWVGNGSQAIPMLVKKVMDGDDPLVIWGSGTQRRSYVHAVDCAAAMLALAENEFDGTVNVGTQETVTMTELVQAILRLSGRTSRLVADPTKPEGRLIKSGDMTRLHETLPNLRLTVNLDEGLRRMIGWYHAAFAEAVQ
jgi:nucleoside-diphosphate-sugar epimerase